ncbi:hypothetical protein QYM36_003388 [Artemia franciscana]|uniref:Uncharacterized protein n=1 Tax=Artemia franciscana TaxID=6661 RepID=A0AA88LCF5_ARTSF|nr:hypothetical protein QYM36_003388 [Artemia franciscana]
MAVRSHYISPINLIVARDSVEVTHDDEHIFLWCLVGDTLKLKEELFALFIASSRVSSIYLDDDLQRWRDNLTPPWGPGIYNGDDWRTVIPCGSGYQFHHMDLIPRMDILQY